MGPFDTETMQRFWSKVDKRAPNECWDWKGAITDKGYGSLSANGKYASAHRFSCYLEHGEPPTLLHHAMHACDRRKCVNPHHLRWGTRAENTIDCAEKMRLPFSRLIPSQVAYIRRLLEVGYADAKVGEWYGVDRDTIINIRLKRSWVNIAPATLIPFISTQQEITM